jgi:hypothetical protein
LDGRWGYGWRRAAALLACRLGRRSMGFSLMYRC